MRHLIPFSSTAHIHVNTSTICPWMLFIECKYYHTIKEEIFANASFRELEIYRLTSYCSYARPAQSGFDPIIWPVSVNLL